MQRICTVLLMATAIASPAMAQIASDDQPRRLVLDRETVSSLAHAHLLPSDQPTSPSAPSQSFDVRPIVEKLTSTFSATRQMRAADATIGMALIALGTRPRHPMSSAVFVGLHAIRIGLRQRTPSALRAFDVRPEVSRNRFAMTIQRTFSDQR